MRGTLTPATYLRVWLLWGGLAAAVFFLCLMLGQGDFGTNHISFHWPDETIRDIRLAHVLAAAIVGAALAAAGVALQALLRNPLAEPYVLGISSGSAVGVTAWLIFTGPLAAFSASSANSALRNLLFSSGQALPSIAGALATCIAVFAIARAGRRGQPHPIEPVTLLLVGVVVSAMNAALLMVLTALGPRALRADLATYMLGAISDNDLNSRLIETAALVLLLAYLPLLFSGAALNAGSLSDAEAVSLGVRLRRLRFTCFLSASALTGAALMLSGPIGFVGLICPHICRSLLGADHRKLVVAAPLCGAAFLMAADTAVRITQNLFGTQLPVGVVTALCGGPFFLFLLKRGRASARPWGGAM